MADDINNPEKKAYPFHNDFDQNIVNIAATIGTAIPVVRGDWLLFEATKPFNYHSLANIPDNLPELETRLGLNRVDNIRRSITDPAQPRIQRAAIGAGRSGVSVNNRVIERHLIPQGIFWISYDFANIEGDSAKSVFSSPLGPAPDITIQDVPNANQNTTNFTPDGGEVIFTMANGLQGYMLVDGVGGRINEGPTDVVFDASARDKEGTVLNGYSCMTCHANGIIKATDELRGFMAQADFEIFPSTVMESVKGIHPEQETLDQTYIADSVRYVDVLKQTVIVGEVGQKITQLADYYDREISYDQLASELNITAAQLKRVEPTLSIELRIELQALSNNQLDRFEFERLYPQLLLEIFNLTQGGIQ